MDRNSLINSNNINLIEERLKGMTFKTMPFILVAMIFQGNHFFNRGIFIMSKLKNDASTLKKMTRTDYEKLVYDTFGNEEGVETLLRSGMKGLKLVLIGMGVKPTTNKRW